MAERPSAEEMLVRARQEAATQAHGRLKVFLGAAPGVGKTYAMLRLGQQLVRDGRRVLVGVVATHGRTETAALLQGLEVLPLRQVEHRGVALEEFDLDAALARAPDLLLVDELAHTNAPGSRHAKRWQDVLELLDAGIDVATTVNVQHVESLNDVVAQITGVRVRETVPDAVLERAAEIQLVDLPPEDLLQRLRDGKVYLGEQVARAADNWFRPGNLMALRELALRATAARVDAQIADYRQAQGIARPWPAGEKVLVCVGPAPQSAALIRAARRMAEALRAPWFAVTVETPSLRQLGNDDRDRLAAHQRLAESLGGECVVLAGDDVAEEVLRFARRENATRIVCGKPTHRLGGLFGRTILDALVLGSDGIDVHLPHVELATAAPAGVPPPRATSWRGWAEAVLVVAAGSGAALWLRGVLSLTDVAMGSLLGITVVAIRRGRGPALLASVLTIVAYDFLFVPPVFTFAVDDLRHVVTFAVMLLIGVVTSALAGRLQAQIAGDRTRAERLRKLHALGRDLAAAGDLQQVAEVAVRHFVDAGMRAAAWLQRRGGPLAVLARAGAAGELAAKELGIATWALDHAQAAGATTTTLGGGEYLHLPLPGVAGAVGVLALLPPAATPLGTETAFVLEQMARQAALAAERAQLAADVRSALVAADAERVRSSLLDAVSHDLRTPLAAITGASGTLLADAMPLTAEARRELLTTIHEEADRLVRYVANLLDMTRLQAGALRLQREWQSVEELVGNAIAAARTSLRGQRVTTDLAPDLPLIAVDEVLVRQVLVNLLDNAAKYSPPGTPVAIAARALDGGVEFEVADRGPGFPPGEEERVFDKFWRGRHGRTGVGLGLTIARGFVQAHGGTIAAGNRAGGGACVRFTLPTGGVPPATAEPAP